MLAVVIRQTGQMAKTGSDPWDHSTWLEMRGERDEGILAISAYRVSQTKGTTSGQNTAQSQQINHMIQEGDTNPDQRTQILQYLGDLVTQKRAEGFRSITMMDTNDDWLQTSSRALRTVVKDMTWSIYIVKSSKPRDSPTQRMQGDLGGLTSFLLTPQYSQQSNALEYWASTRK